MTLPWYPFYWGDYSKKTMHLTQGQHGAYILFLHWVYTTGTPVPHKQRFGIARATTEQERSDATAMLETFFERRGQCWHSTKAEEVIEEATIKHTKRVQAGKLGGISKASNATKSSSNALPTTTTSTEEKRRRGARNRPSVNGVDALPLTPERLEELTDKADQIMRRGKYAETYG